MGNTIIDTVTVKDPNTERYVDLQISKNNETGEYAAIDIRSAKAKLSQVPWYYIVIAVCRENIEVTDHSVKISL